MIPFFQQIEHDLEQRALESMRNRGGVQAVSTCAPSVMSGSRTIVVDRYATMAYFPGASQADPNFFQYHNQSSEQLEANRKKHVEAEETAKNFIVNVLGEEQAEVYNRSMRVILKPGKHFWVIGDVNKSYHEQDPFVGKPDVIRIDNQDKLHYTSFCVDQRGGGPTPYTDKVVSFAIHCFNDEKSFIKTINRIREDTLKEMPECAVLK